MSKGKVLIIIASISAFAAACGQTATNSTPTVANNSAPVTAAPPNTNAANTVDQALNGKELYAKNCMICHKETGKGGKLTLEGKTINPDDLTTAKMADKTEEKLYEYISEGFPDDGMPAFKDKLKDAEIKAIVSHVRTLQSGIEKGK